MAKYTCHRKQRKLKGVKIVQKKRHLRKWRLNLGSMGYCARNSLIYGQKGLWARARSDKRNLKNSQLQNSMTNSEAAFSIVLIRRSLNFCHSEAPPLKQLAQIKMKEEYVTAKFDYKGEQGSLSFSSGDSIKVLSRLPSGWWDGICNGERGWFPSNYVSLPKEELESLISPLTLNSPNFPPPTSPISVRNPTNQQLPENWGIKALQDGKQYYFNLMTNETKWSFHSLERQGGLDLPDSPEEDKGLIFTWPGMSDHLEFKLKALIKESREKNKHTYLNLTLNIVQTVHLMFYASSTEDRGCKILQQSGSLKKSHSKILSGLAKLILAAKLGSTVWPPPDSEENIQLVSLDLLKDVKEFTKQAERLDLKLRTLSEEEIAKQSAIKHSSDINRQKQTDSELIDKLEAKMVDISILVSSIQINHIPIDEDGNPRTLATTYMDKKSLVETIQKLVANVGAFISLVDDLPIGMLFEELTMDFKVCRLNLLNSITELVMNVRKIPKTRTLPDLEILEKTLLSIEIVVRSTKDLLIATKFLIEEKENAEHSTLKTKIELNSGPADDLDLDRSENTDTHSNASPMFALKQLEVSARTSIFNGDSENGLLSPTSDKKYSQPLSLRVNNLRSKSSNHALQDAVASDSIAEEVESAQPAAIPSTTKNTEKPSPVSALTDSNIGYRASQDSSQPDNFSIHSGSSRAITSPASGIGQIAYRNIIERSSEHSSRSPNSLDRDDGKKLGIGQARVRNIVTEKNAKKKRELANTGIGKVPDWIRKKQEKEKAMSPSSADQSIRTSISGASLLSAGSEDSSSSSNPKRELFSGGIGKFPDWIKKKQKATSNPVSPGSANVNSSSAESDGSSTKANRELASGGIGQVPDWIKKKQAEKINVDQDISNHSAEVDASVPDVQNLLALAAESNANFSPIEDEVPLSEILEETFVDYAKLALEKEDFDSHDMHIVDGRAVTATLSAIVCKLTSHISKDESFNNSFLLTYRTVTTTSQFLGLLFARFRMAAPKGLNKEETKVWSEKKLKLVRIRVFAILKLWLECYIQEGEEDRNALTVVMDFAENDIKPHMTVSYVTLVKLIERRRQSGMKSYKTAKLSTMKEVAPTSILPKNIKKFKLYELDPVEFSRQITIQMAEIYGSIEANEFLSKAWNINVPTENMNKMMEFCRKLTNWIVFCILQVPDAKKRGRAIGFFISVANVISLINF